MTFLSLVGRDLKLWSLFQSFKHFHKLYHSNVAYKSQVQTMFHWKLGSPLTEKNTVPNVFPVKVGSLEKSVLFVESMKDFGYELDTCSTVHVPFQSVTPSHVR